MTWILQSECDCKPRNDLRSCDDCEHSGELISCLDYFDIKVVIPDDPFDEFAGTYVLNNSPERTRQDIEVQGSCQSATFTDLDRDVHIALLVTSHPYMSSIFYSVAVSTPKGGMSYGTRYNKGSIKVVNPTWCESHCNGTFVGVRAEKDFSIKIISWSGYLSGYVGWIQKVPGSFKLSPDQFWGDLGEYSDPCEYTCVELSDPELENASRPPVGVDWQLKTRPATQIDVDADFAQFVGQAIPITFPKVLKRYQHSGL